MKIDEEEEEESISSHLIFSGQLSRFRRVHTHAVGSDGQPERFRLFTTWGSTDLEANRST
jgi:hypothetical protein